MTAPTFFLSWESHRNNICNGLSILQQNEEFVDMTLAADGHHVKVHQMVMALASPYIKDLISSTDSRHPIIFLHKTSYSTLSAILEYIYTGEVVVAMDSLADLVQAAKELHIRGLEDMKLQDPAIAGRRLKLTKPEDIEQPDYVQEDSVDEELQYLEEINEAGGHNVDTKSHDYALPHHGSVAEESNMTCSMDDAYIVSDMSAEKSVEQSNAKKVKMEVEIEADTEMTPRDRQTVIQYTVSNQGSLQMILNRFLYYLKHSNRDNSRQWRCVDYLNSSKCPALVVTKDDVVVQRISAHNHAFHDKRILKKVNAGAVYMALQEAEVQGLYVKAKNKNDEDAVCVE